MENILIAAALMIGLFLFMAINMMIGFTIDCILFRNRMELPYWGFAFWLVIIGNCVLLYFLLKSPLPC